MVAIRRGKKKDFKDLLTVYQTTRWYYRSVPDGYLNVDQVRQEHSGVAFKRWGWLVAEKDDSIVGEIVFNIEKNLSSGKLGVIRNLDVDVRFQKTTIGTQLTRAAEDVLRKKKAVRIVALTPPEAYNYWMKIGYFARGSLIELEKHLSRISRKVASAVSGLKRIEIKDVKKLPKTFRFSNKSVPGMLAESVSRIIDKGEQGKLLEFRIDDKLVGVSTIIKEDKGNAQFIVDFPKRGVDYAPSIIANTALAASRWRIKKVCTVIPKDQLQVYGSVGSWSSEDARSIPVTRII